MSRNSPTRPGSSARLEVRGSAEPESFGYLGEKSSTLGLAAGEPPVFEHNDWLRLEAICESYENGTAAGCRALQTALAPMLIFKNAALKAAAKAAGWSLAIRSLSAKEIE